MQVIRVRKRSRARHAYNGTKWWNQRVEDDLNIPCGNSDSVAIGFQRCVSRKETVKWKINHPLNDLVNDFEPRQE